MKQTLENLLRIRRELPRGGLNIVAKRLGISKMDVYNEINRVKEDYNDDIINCCNEIIDFQNNNVEYYATRSIDRAVQFAFEESRIAGN